MDEQGQTEPAELSLWTAKVLVVAKLAVAISVVGGLLVLGADVFLLLFAGVLVAIFLRSISHWLAAHTPLSDGWALGLTMVVLLGLSVGGGGLVAPSIANQTDKLMETLPEAYATLKTELQKFQLGRYVTRSLGNPGELLAGSPNVLGKATGLVSGTLSWIANLFIIFFTGLYLASEPETYRKGFVRLFAVSRRERIDEVLVQAGHALQWWLLGKIASMVLIGVLTAVGLWALGVPLAPALAMIAAVLTFIPNVGPILAAAPAMLLALADSPMKVLYVVALYTGIQTVESYLVTPLIQRRTVSIPPALTLSAQILAGVIFGIVGVALATPLAVAALVLVHELYVRDVLEGGAPEPSAS